MNKDFHYYATYCAAILAGYSHKESMAICYSAQFVDLCTVTFLTKVHGPMAAATTQLQLELADARTDLIGLQDMTRIWSSFHFLPQDLYKNRGGHCGRTYINKYRLICVPNGALLADTVNLAKGKSLQAAGLAMHVLADTWAHRYFAGTPSLVINSTNDYFYEILEANGESGTNGETRADGVSGADGKIREVPVHFIHSPNKPDDLEHSTYTNSLAQNMENSIMNLGHGRAGHLPDYSFIRYRYMPSWADYKEIVKDNPHDYMCAFTQMVYALKYLRGGYETFETDKYDTEAVAPWESEIEAILTKRQLDSCADWKAFGKKLSGYKVEDFDLDKYRNEYVSAESESEKDSTFLGKFFIAALAQKSMVTAKIFRSGNMLVGFSLDYNGNSKIGIKDYMALIRHHKATGEVGHYEDTGEEGGNA